MRRYSAIGLLLAAFSILMMWPFFLKAAPLNPKLPGDSAQLLPVLDSEIKTHWPDLVPKAYVASVIDQESNWKINAQLKTSRELGCGLGQFTVAYDKNGNVRFDAIEEMKRLDPSLADWNWRECSKVQYQLRAAVIKLKVNERSCKALMKPGQDVKFCDSSAYNGGIGGINSRIRMCRMKGNCAPDIWIGNLREQCAASKTKVQGYGESFCDINSKYPERVSARMYKFLPFWPLDETAPPIETKK